MAENYDIIESVREIAAGSDEQAPIGVGFDEGMLSAVEVRQMQIADPGLALNLIANRSPGRVLDLLKIGSVGIAGALINVAVSSGGENARPPNVGQGPAEANGS